MQIYTVLIADVLICWPTSDVGSEVTMGQSDLVEKDN